MPPKPRAPKPKKKAEPESGGLGSRRNLLIVGGIAVLVAAVLIIGSLVLTGGDDEPTASAASDLTGIPQEDIVLGDEAANVTLIVYEDGQCPICKRYSETGFPGLVDEYVRPGKVNMEFRGLAFIGPDSQKALRFIYAAGEQDKLWDFTEATYANQGGENEGWVTDNLMREIGEEVGLDVDKLFADADSDVVTQKIERAQQQGAEAEVPGTPWFYIKIGNDEPYEIQPTSLSPEAFRDALDAALQG